MLSINYYEHIHLYKKHIFDVSFKIDHLNSKKTNKELLIRLKDGDILAFDEIYNKFCKKLFGFVFQHIKHEADAEEIVQEVFIKIWESRNKIDVYSSFDSFIFTIAYNATISLIRKRITDKKYIEHIHSLQSLDNGGEIIDEIQFKELTDKIQMLLNKLTPRQKEVFLLSRDEGLTHDQIAQKLNISPNTVKNHLVTVLSFLKSNIDTTLTVNLLFYYLFIY